VNYITVAAKDLLGPCVDEHQDKCDVPYRTAAAENLDWFGSDIPSELMKGAAMHRLTWALMGLLVPTVLWAQTTVQVTIRNLSPTGGIHLTPVWVGFHNGAFDIYDQGVASSTALERIAEDGSTGPITTLFSGSGAGTVQGTILGPGAGAGFPGAPVIPPGGVAIMQFVLDGSLASSRFFSYASMIVPSNDAFIANGNPQAFQIFSNTGNFLGASFTVNGNMVLDAGTEVNDELPANTAFFGQAAPDTGVTENGVVGLHPGFIPGGAILSDPRFNNANFLAGGYQVAQFTIAAVPEPSTYLLIGLALSPLGLKAVRKKMLAKWSSRRHRSRS
jgi:hypothetical protein